MAGRAKPQTTYPKSKAIAAITTLLSAVISQLPHGRIKEILLVLVGTVAYFAYHSFVITKNLVLREGVRWVSLTIAEWKVKNTSGSLKLKSNALKRRRKDWRRYSFR